MRKNKIPMKKVQVAFANAIKRRDCRCMIKDYDPCCGQLECSHFFTQGSTPSLMFYPLNAYAQCSKHHQKHHNDKEWKGAYEEWLSYNHNADLEKMQRMKNKVIKYDDDLKATIIRLCDYNKLAELTELIEEELGEGSGEEEGSVEN